MDEAAKKVRTMAVTRRYELPEVPNAFKRDGVLRHAINSREPGAKAHYLNLCPSLFGPWLTVSRVLKITIRHGNIYGLLLSLNYDG